MSGALLTGVWRESLRGRGDLEDIEVDNRILLQGFLKNSLDRLYPEFIWLRIWTSGVGQGFFF